MEKLAEIDPEIVKNQLGEILQKIFQKDKEAYLKLQYLREERLQKERAERLRIEGLREERLQQKSIGNYQANNQQSQSVWNWGNNDQEINVKGYKRKDGTYVKHHKRHRSQ